MSFFPVCIDLSVTGICWKGYFTYISQIHVPMETDLEFGFEIPTASLSRYTVVANSACSTLVFKNTYFRLLNFQTIQRFTKDYDVDINSPSRTFIKSNT